MMEEIAVRYVHGSADFDVSQVAQMLCSLDKMHHEHDPSRFPLFSFEQRKKDVLDIAGAGYLFYAQFNENFVGFATVSKKAHSLMIDHLYVESAFRHKHVGTKLVTCIFDTFQGQDIFTSVYAFNAEALNFYQTLFEMSSVVFKRKGSLTGGPRLR